MRRVLALLVAAALFAAGLVALVSRDGVDDRRRAAASPASARVAVARPVPPKPAGRVPRSVEVLRVGDTVVTMKRVVRDDGPARYRRVRCLDSVSARNVATRRFQASAG